MQIRGFVCMRKSLLVIYFKSSDAVEEGCRWVEIDLGWVGKRKQLHNKITIFLLRMFMFVIPQRSSRREGFFDLLGGDGFESSVHKLRDSMI